VLSPSNGGKDAGAHRARVVRRPYVCAVFTFQLAFDHCINDIIIQFPSHAIQFAPVVVNNKLVGRIIDKIDIFSRIIFQIEKLFGGIIAVTKNIFISPLFSLPA
jgi:hypothetical protein